MIDSNLEPYAQSFFTKGMEEGKLKGLQEGELRGERRGERKGELKGLLNSLILVLETRFGQLSTEQKNQLIELNAQVLPQLLKKSVSVASLQEFLTDI
jgi:flagellar biosynthesis/type III secretory pathway protein FliH